MRHRSFQRWLSFVPLDHKYSCGLVFILSTILSVYLQPCFHLITRFSICHTMEHIDDSTTPVMDVFARGHQHGTTGGQEPDEDVYEYASASS